MTKIAIGCDHGGFERKEEVVKILKDQGFVVFDCGCYAKERCDYPDFAKEVAFKVAKNEVDFGVVICTSGEGICMAANKVKGIRCGIAYNDEVAMLMKLHNNANCLAFGAKFMTTEEVVKRINIFNETEFEGGRHVNRVNKISELEK